MHVALTQFNTGIAEGEGWVTRNTNNMHQKKAQIPALVKTGSTWLKLGEEEIMFDQARFSYLTVHEAMTLICATRFY